MPAASFPVHPGAAGSESPLAAAADAVSPRALPGPPADALLSLQRRWDRRGVHYPRRSTYEAGTPDGGAAAAADSPAPGPHE